MTLLNWRYDNPWLRPGVVAAFADGHLLGAYRKRYRHYVVTYDLIVRAPVWFRSEDEVREHLQAVADGRWPS